MIEFVGEYGLSLTILVALCGLLTSIAGGVSGDRRAIAASKASIVLIAVLVTLCCAALLKAMLASDFRFQYVINYSERALPAGYKIAAFWAGQEGSLLLWAWLLAMVSVLALLGWRRKTGREFTFAYGVLAAISGFFTLIMLFTANPFAMVQGPVPADGSGLNPMLQDPGMIIHPPLLFIGYAGFTVPFALLIGVLLVGRKDNHWLADTRRWLLFSWLFLTAGIVLGAWWAYVELGWGGYWAWDPVENASLLPWLTATAVLHSMIAQQHRGMFKRWNVSLIAMSFILCIFGTYLTRSGVISSVHAYSKSWVGNLFLIFLVVLVLLSVGLLAWRWKALKPDHRIESYISREGAFLYGNILLTGMMLVTLIGTIYPILSATFGDPITLTPAFYNKWVAPIGLLLAFLMAHGPVLAFGRSAAKDIARDMFWPGVGAMVGTAVVAVMMTINPWALLCTFIAVLGTLAVIVGFARVVSARHRSTGEAWIVAAIRMIDADKRRYGAQMAHLGLMLFIIGVASSSLFKVEQDISLVKGEPQTVGRYTMELESLEMLRGANYQAIQATVRITGADGDAITLTPQRREYDKWRRQMNTEVALHSSWREDVYVILGGVSPDMSHAGFSVLLSPLVLWIWLGGIVMTFAGVFCMLPRFLPHAHRAPAPRAVPESPAVATPTAPPTTAPLATEGE
jgi:cytochrome c-type biogenesis protein CcmF